MKKYIVITLLLTNMVSAQAQDSIRSRVILIGDAGELSNQQRCVLTDASQRILPGKTTVIYLGDNVYPNGMAMPGSADSARTQAILRSQFIPMREQGAPVYFLPGNHDWDRMGKNGLMKIREQTKYLESFQDSLLKLVPSNGCPEPEEIKVSDSLVIIAWDSEWWLFPYNKTGDESDCLSHSKKEVLERMAELFYRNRFKTILLASHHPFKSYGHHGGYFSLKDHIFPLTAASKNLYIPLPIIGSLYPLLRSSFVSPEDAGHPLYKDMVSQVNGVFAGFPNLVHVAGHEHGLQLINEHQQLQIVSGGGAKNAFVKNGKYSLFADKSGGYVIADLLNNNNLRLTYYAANDTGVSESFTYLQVFTDLKKPDNIVRNTHYPDTVKVSAHASYDSINSVRRSLLGENYRKEWATPTSMPVIKISEIKGGLVPIMRGGGFQSVSLRLKDKKGKEWVLRSVNKNPEKVLPEVFRQTFAKDIFVDAMSAQHPYSALVVPVIANAAGVPHANPLIGLVVPDSALGIYEKDFANTVCLLEEREPIGKSDNSEKMFRELIRDNDNGFDSTIFLKARLLDLFLGDWDRHVDQWRWVYEKESKSKRYIAVPRDRDQVFHVMQGLFPNVAASPFAVPYLHDFNGKIREVNSFFTASNELNKHFLNGFGEEEWMRITTTFINAMTDSVLETALSRLPPESYRLRHDELLQKWKERRANIPDAMKTYYHFLNRIVDLETSDKNELVSFTDAPGNALQVTINKINKNGKITDELYKRIFEPDITKEIRLFLYKGNDSVVVNTKAPIKLRMVGAEGEKAYQFTNAAKRIDLYGKENNVKTYSEISKLKQHLSNDSLNTNYVTTNPYDRVIPLITGGYNSDNGVSLGFSIKLINQGFRKKPYSSIQQFSFQHSFATTAFSSSFHGEWVGSPGKPDFIADMEALAPDNTQNYFGLGNNTVFYKTGDYLNYYRTTFRLYEINPALRWRFRNSSLSVGPSLQSYLFDPDENEGRLINNPSLIGTYDSATIENDKTFAGIRLNFVKDGRNNGIMPSAGVFAHVGVLIYTGLNSYSKSFAQIKPEIVFYKSLDRQAAVVIADRVGAGLTFGNTTFYQSLFLGGQENLYGYKLYRFAGQQMLYNNLEARIRLFQIGSYILPGQLGLVGFYDAGKVWAPGHNSSTIHQGVGGGLYFAPAQLTVVQFVAGYSEEGWYPYLRFGFRF